MLGIIYHPPNDNDPAILDYLWQSLSSIESRFPSCGLLIVGDFNRLNTKRLQNSFDLKQIVTFPTRGDRTLTSTPSNVLPMVYQITCPERYSQGIDPSFPARGGKKLRS